MTEVIPEPAWKQFETAVADLIQALAPDAKVLTDVKLPDIHTGLARQRDVWIETRFAGHFPITILVSCKRTKAKISQQHMDAFIGELRSSGASCGILYSASGFSKPALAKAKKLGICCCMLIENGRPDLPGMIAFSSYCFREQGRLTIIGPVDEIAPSVDALFDLKVREGDGETTVIAALLLDYGRALEDARKRFAPGRPPTWAAAVQLTMDELPEPVTVQLSADWRAYRAGVEATLVNGSYCFNNQDFKGSYSTPIVDRFGDHPGPGWEEIDGDEVAVEGCFTSMIFYGGDWESALREQMGSRKPSELSTPGPKLDRLTGIDPIVTS